MLVDQLHSLLIYYLNICVYLYVFDFFVIHGGSLFLIGLRWCWLFTCRIESFVQLKEQWVLMEDVECDRLSFVCVNLDYIQLLLVGHQL